MNKKDFVIDPNKFYEFEGQLYDGMKLMALFELMVPAFTLEDLTRVEEITEMTREDLTGEKNG